MLDAFMFGLFVVSVFVLNMFNLAECGMVFGMFLRDVGGKFRPVGRAPSFDFLDFFLGEFRDFGGCCGFRFFCLVFGLFFRFFFVEFGTADDGIGLGFFLRLFVLGFDETGSESGDLIFVQFRVIPHGFDAVAGRFLQRLDDSAARRGRFLRRTRSRSGRRCFRSRIGQEPAGQAAGEPARNVAGARSGCGQIAGGTRRNFLGGNMLFVRFLFNNGKSCGRDRGLVAILCQRFTWEDDLVLGGIGYRRHKSARSFRAPILKTARRTAAILVSARLAALGRSIF